MERYTIFSARCKDLKPGERGRGKGEKVEEVRGKDRRREEEGRAVEEGEV